MRPKIIVIASIFFAFLAGGPVKSHQSKNQDECEGEIMNLENITVQETKPNSQKIFSFSKECKTKLCEITVTYVPEEKKVAKFKIKSNSKYCKNVDVIDFPSNGSDDDCAQNYVEERIWMDVEPASGEMRLGRIEFHSIKKSSPEVKGKICFDADTADGPNLATFTGTFRGSDYVAYIYDEEVFFSIKDAQRASQAQFLFSK